MPNIIIPITLLEVLTEIGEVTDDDLRDLNKQLSPVPKGMPRYQLESYESRVLLLMYEQNMDDDSHSFLVSLFCFLLIKRIGPEVQEHLENGDWFVYKDFFIGLLCAAEDLDKNQKEIFDSMGIPPTPTHH